MKLLFRARWFGAALAFFCAWATALRAADEKSPADKKPLPSAQEILERYSKAVGGKESFKKHHSQHALGSVEIAGNKGKMEVFAARPNKLLVKMTMPGTGEVTTGFDGDVAWIAAALTGPMLVEGKQKEQIATQADFDLALHDPRHYKTMTVLGIEEFNGEPCYKLKLVHRTGYESTEYFSIKTGLQRGFTATQESPFGRVTATTLVTDYKQFGDLLLPSRTSQKTMGFEMVTTIEEMEYDKVDPSVFELPADVKALIEKPAEKPADKADAPKPLQKKESAQQAEK